MPTCPNCGSYVSLGNHSCSCGTTIRYDDSDEKEYLSQRECLDNPYDYDFLNELYHNYSLTITCLEEMNTKIGEVEEKFSANFRDYSIAGPFFILSFTVEAPYFDAVISASFDSTYAYNEMKMIEDIVSPDFSKLYAIGC